MEIIDSVPSSTARGAALPTVGEGVFYHKLFLSSRAMQAFEGSLSSRHELVRAIHESSFDDEDLDRKKLNSLCPRHVTDIDSDCSICLSTMVKKEVKSLPCIHTFHIECIDKWLKKSTRCPLCRKNYKEDFANDIEFTDYDIRLFDVEDASTTRERVIEFPEHRFGRIEREFEMREREEEREFEGMRERFGRIEREFEEEREDAQTLYTTPREWFRRIEREFEEEREEEREFGRSQRAIDLIERAAQRPIDRIERAAQRETLESANEFPEEDIQLVIEHAETTRENAIAFLRRYPDPVDAIFMCWDEK